MSRNIYDYIESRNILKYDYYNPIINYYSKGNLEIIIYGGDVDIISKKDNFSMCPVFSDTINISENSYEFLDSIMKAV